MAESVDCIGGSEENVALSTIKEFEEWYQEVVLKKDFWSCPFLTTIFWDETSIRDNEFVYDSFCKQWSVWLASKKGLQSRRKGQEP